MINFGPGVCKASVKYIPVCHYKMQVLVTLIRNMNVKDARLQLSFSKKDGAYYLKKLLDSCIANGTMSGMSIEKMFVCHATTGKAMTLRRFMPRGRGRSTRIEKRYSTLTVALSEKVVASSNRVSKFKKINSSVDKNSLVGKPTSVRTKGVVS